MKKEKMWKMKKWRDRQIYGLFQRVDNAKEQEGDSDTDRSRCTRNSRQRPGKEAGRIDFVLFLCLMVYQPSWVI